MAKFINTVTGNVLETEEPLTIALMSRNDRYKAVDEVAETEAEKHAAKKSTKKAVPAENA